MIEVKLVFRSILVTVVFLRLAYMAIMWFELPIELLIFAYVLSTFGLLGVILVVNGYIKIGYYIVVAYNLICLPIGIFPILAARAIFEDSLRLEIFERYKT